MNRTSWWSTAIFCLVAVGLLTGATTEKQGCGAGLDNREGEPGIDVGGVAGADWKVTYSDKMEVIVKNAGAAAATYNFAWAAGGTFDVDGVAIDLNDWCARDDVVCPFDVFPGQVRMTQPGSQLHLLYVDYTAKGPLAELKEVRLLGNVDSDDDFSIALGIGAAAAGTCGLLGVSYATGHINGDGGDPPKGHSLSGDIVTAYSGGCVLLGNSGAVGAGLTVEFRIPFTATRL